MKILRVILLFSGIILTGFGVISIWVPQVNIQIESENNQIIGLIGLGIIALLASIFAKNRR